jgi:hypothetical protein
MDELLISRFRAALAPLIDAAKPETDREISKRAAEFAARGTYHSSMHAFAVADVLNAAFCRENELAWSTLRRVHEARGSQLSEDLREGLKTEMRRLIKEAGNQNAARLAELAKRMSNENFKTEIVQSVAARELARYEAEVDLYVDSLEIAAKRRGGEPAQPHYHQHFYAPVGAVQTAAGATATINQTFNPDQLEVLRTAFNAAIAALSANSSIDAIQKREVIEVAEDAVKELGSESPNKTRLRTALSAVAQTVQTLGSAGAAWELLRRAGAILGLSL